MTDAPDAQSGERRHGHLSATEISDLLEGLLDPASIGRAGAHLAACAECRGLRAALDNVQALLVGLPDPGPMPAHVVEAVTGALRAERAGTDSARTDSVGGDNAGAVIPIVPRQRAHPGRRLRLLQAAAVLVLLFSAGALVLPGLRGGDDATSSSTGALSGGQRDATEAQGGGGSAERQDSAATGGRVPTTSGSNYTRASLAGEIAALLREPPLAMPGASEPHAALSLPAPAASDGASPARRASAAPTRLVDPVALAGCIAALAARSETAALKARSGAAPLAVDLARFEGAPAAVIVLPGQAPDRVAVFIVGPGCRRGDPQLRYSTRVTR